MKRSLKFWEENPEKCVEAEGYENKWTEYTKKLMKENPH